MNTQQPPGTPMQADCQAAQEWIVMTLDADAIAEDVDAGAISADEQAVLERHVAGCAACQAYQHTMHQLMGSVCALDEVPVPDALTDRIMARIAQEKPLPAEASEPSSTVASVTPLPTRPLSWKRYMPLAAACLLIAIAIPLTRQWTEAPRTPGATSSQSVAQNTPASDAPTIASIAADGPSDSRPHKPNASSDSKPATPQRPSTVRTAIASNTPVQTGVASPATSTSSTTETRTTVAPEDSNLVASLPSQYLDSTYASDERSDVYYDPVSTLVGF